MIEWAIYARCPCGNMLLMSGNGINVSLPDCYKCGLPRTYWRVQSARWISTSHWYRPSTWMTGYWEYKGVN